jgi:hypothetical protein
MPKTFNGVDYVEYSVENRTLIRVWAPNDVVLEIGDNGRIYFNSLAEIKQLAEDIQSIISDIEK